MRNDIICAINAIRYFARYWRENFKDAEQSVLLDIRYGVECVETLMGDEELTRKEHKDYEYLFGVNTYEAFVDFLEESSIIDIVIDRLEAS